MNNWKMWKWLGKRDIPAYIEVESESFNPTKELIDSLKSRIVELQAAYNMEVERNGELLNQVAALRAQISNTPRVEPPVIKHFNTYSALKAELELRDRVKKQELDADKIKNSSSTN